jgi:hypothetical protein
MSHLGSHHGVRRVARGNRHRLAGRDTAARDAIPGGTADMFHDLGEAA